MKILYLGDYDPSGLDMIRDIRDRIIEFVMGDHVCEDDTQDFKFSVIPIALTIEQIRQYNPPANPAKKTDPRSKDFIKNHGSTSWEVDALRPEILNQLLTDAIRINIDEDVFNEIVSREHEDKEKLKALYNYL